MVFVEQNSSADQRDLIDRLDQQAKGSSIQGGVYTHSHLVTFCGVRLTWTLAVTVFTDDL